MRCAFREACSELVRLREMSREKNSLHPEVPHFVSAIIPVMNFISPHQTELHLVKHRQSEKGVMTIILSIHSIV